jgi:hypothetical protein
MFETWQSITAEQLRDPQPAQFENNWINWP